MPTKTNRRRAAKSTRRARGTFAVTKKRRASHKKCAHKTHMSTRRTHRRRRMRMAHRGGFSGLRYMIQGALHSDSSAINALNGNPAEPSPLPWNDQYR